MARLRFCPGSDKKLTAPFKPAKNGKTREKKEKGKVEKRKEKDESVVLLQGFKKENGRP